MAMLRRMDYYLFELSFGGKDWRLLFSDSLLVQEQIEKD
jgi:hypothetical protein